MAGPAPGAEPAHAPIQAAVERLRAGEPVVVPTETVFGVACDAMNQRAVDSLFALKGRPDFNPLPVLVADVDAARVIAGAWPEQADRLARAFWPGPLTIVVPLGAPLAESVTRALGTVALRCPAHPVARALSRAFAAPLALTSANRSGHAPARTLEEARAFVRAAGRGETLILEGGPAPTGEVSTIVRAGASDAPVAILRPGALSEQAIRDALR